MPDVDQPSTAKIVPIYGKTSWQHVHPTPMLRWAARPRTMPDFGQENGAWDVKKVLEQLFIIEEVDRADGKDTVTDIRQEWRAVPTEDGP